MPGQSELEGKMAEHVIPDTAENRAKFEEESKKQLAKLGLNPDRVEIWEDGYRVQEHEGDSFEWWYFDMHFDDGSTMVVTFSNKPHTNPDAPLTPQLLVIRKHAGQESVRQVLEFDASEFEAATDACNVRIGKSTVAGDLDHYVLHIEADNLVADIEIDRVAPSWRPGAAVSYFDAAQKHYLAWVVPVPYGVARATVVEDGQTKQLTGDAYHDHNWGNKLMGSFLEYWYWGRAHVGDYTLVYVRMTTKYVFPIGQYHLTTFLLAKGGEILTDAGLPLQLEVREEVPGPGHQSYPQQLVWTWKNERGTVELNVTNPELIESIDMGEDRRGLEKLLRAAEHPMYYDFNADIELTIDLDGVQDRVTGRTLYEKMMFR